MSNPYIPGVVTCETCDKELLAINANRLDGANENYYLCDQCMYGKLPTRARIGYVGNEHIEELQQEEQFSGEVL